MRELILLHQALTKVSNVYLASFEAFYKISNTFPSVLVANVDQTPDLEPNLNSVLWFLSLIYKMEIKVPMSNSQCRS